MSEAKHWWETVPAILGGIAAVIAAIGGLIAVLNKGPTPQSAPLTPTVQEGKPAAVQPEKSPSSQSSAVNRAAAIPPNTQKVLQHASYILASGNCADPKNTDREGYNNPACTWFKNGLSPQLANGELHISLKLVIELSKVCEDPHRRAEVFLAYGETREEKSSPLGCNNCNQITQEYSLSGMIKTSGSKSIPVRVFINPRGCTEATLKSGELSYMEVQL